MQVMLKQVGDLSIYDLTYPCFVAGIPENSQRILHVPGVYEYKSLDNAYSYVVEGYKTGDKFYLFDCMDINLWYKQKCNKEYYKRLYDLRNLINGDIANYNTVLDLPMVECQTPIDVKEYLDNLEEAGYKNVRIMASDGIYIFGESEDGEYVEIYI